MKCESKVCVTYTVKGDDQVLIASYETGDNELYVWKQIGGDPKGLCLSISATEAEELSEALKQLAVKMRHEMEA